MDGKIERTVGAPSETHSQCHDGHAQGHTAIRISQSHCWNTRNAKCKDEEQPSLAPLGQNPPAEQKIWGHTGNVRDNNNPYVGQGTQKSTLNRARIGEDYF